LSVLEICGAEYSWNYGLFGIIRPLFAKSSGSWAWARSSKFHASNFVLRENHNNKNSASNSKIEQKKSKFRRDISQNVSLHTPNIPPSHERPHAVHS
jgi:hypothetical protein